KNRIGQLVQSATVRAPEGVHWLDAARHDDGSYQLRGTRCLGVRYIGQTVVASMSELRELAALCEDDGIVVLGLDTEDPSLSSTPEDPGGRSGTPSPGRNHRRATGRASEGSQPAHLRWPGRGTDAEVQAAVAETLARGLR